MEDRNVKDNKGKSSSQARSGVAMHLVSFNFKVPLRVRQQFKMFAARHNMTMTEILVRLLDEALIVGFREDAPAAKSRNDEMTK